MAHKETFASGPWWPFVGPSLAYWRTLTSGIAGFFEPNAMAFLGAHMPLGVDAAGYYSTLPLRQTLLDLVDFDLINRNKPRLMVGAAHIRTSRMHYFDSRETRIGPEHIMASGALPPAFPAVRIDGELYWDGGILSNTPTEAIFEDNPRKNSLIFAVHLWNPVGAPAVHHLGGAASAERHPVFKPGGQSHRAAAAVASAAPYHHGALGIHPGSSARVRSRT